MYFGFRDLEVEVAAPRLRFGPLSAHQPSAYRRGFGKTLLLQPLRSSSLISLECTYGLRFIEPNNRGDPRRAYSLRQMAVCNKRDSDINQTTWLFVAPPPDVALAFSEHVEKRKTAAFGNPFEVHLLLFKFAISSWRPYLVHLREEVQQHVSFIMHLQSRESGFMMPRQTQSFWLHLLGKGPSVLVGAVISKD
jgi:hypothetical protein